LVSGGDDRTVRFWNIDSGRQTRMIESAHEKLVKSLDVSPDGKTLATGGGDANITLWNFATGDPRATFRGHFNVVYAVRFSPNGKTLASGCFDNTIRLWDVKTGKSISPREK
jgi:WD40 repeat protein